MDERFFLLLGFSLEEESSLLVNGTLLSVGNDRRRCNFDEGALEENPCQSDAESFFILLLVLLTVLLEAAKSGEDER